MSWCIVTFEEDNTVEVVPQTCINGDKCSWPKFKGKNSQELFTRAVKNSIIPDRDSSSYKIRILSIFKTYDEARRKLKLVEEQSDLSTDVDTKGNRKNKKRKVISSSESESEENGDTWYGIQPFPDNSTATGNKSFNQGHESSCMRESLQPTMNRQESSNSLDIINSNPLNNHGSITMGNRFLNQGHQSNHITENLHAAINREETNNNSNNDNNFLNNNCSTIGNRNLNKDHGSRSTNVRENLHSTINRKETASTDNNLQWNIAHIKMNIDKILTILKTRQDCVCGRTSGIEVPFEDDEWKLPLSTIDEVLAFERQLCNYKKIGFKVDEITKLILRKLFADNVAAMFSWQGKKKKRVFCDLALSDIIKKAVQASPNGRSATDMDIVSSIKNWLRHAPQRCENNKKVNSKNKGDEANDDDK